MGNNNQQANQSFNPNFNMNEYNQKLNQIRGQYNNHNLPSGGGFTIKKQFRTLNCQQVQRAVYIFKTTIKIVAESDSLVVSFQYNAPQNISLTLQIFLGVSKIEFDEQTKECTKIVSLQDIKENLQPGEKVKFQKKYNLDPKKIKQLNSNSIMIRLVSGEEASEYSLNYANNWKVTVENYKKQSKLYGIQDIYGEQGQQCIICFTEKSNTMIQPCKHLCLCSSCSVHLLKNSDNCPICRKRIKNAVKLNKD